MKYRPTGELMFRGKWGIVIGTVLIGLLAVPDVIAETTAGQAVAVRLSTVVFSQEGKANLLTGMKIVAGDRIKTDRQGQAQLLFSDGTKLVVGPNSSLVIESYLLRSNNRVNDFTVRALGGSFRMITGKSRKKAYKIKTPTATIGVRGTSFDFTVEANGTTDVVLFEGEAQVCGRNGTCKILNRSCSVARAPRKTDVRILQEARNRNAQIKRNFPYVQSQRSLRRAFRVRTNGCGELARVSDPIEKTRPHQTRPPAPAAEPAPSGEPGNPGNGGPMGNAGSNPSKSDFGDPDRGRSDTAPGRGKSRGS